jgi:DNA recombination protein RmuC
MGVSELVLVIVIVLVFGGVLAAILWRRKPQADTTSQATLQQMFEVMRSTQQELARQRESTQTEMARTRDELRRSLGDSHQAIQQRLAEANQTVNARLGQAAKLFSDINQGLGSVTEFSKQLSSLRDVFQSPKLRGNIGEQVLRDLLEQVLPRAHFHMQFKFREGQVVDAIVKTKQGIIPIDSKFPLENFRAISSDPDDGAARKLFVRDVKKHIDAIHTKYILPEEGTVDFAVMYVPSEAVYYEIMQRSEGVLDYAAEKRVYLVSPNTFFYFLKVILIGLEGARMEEISRKIVESLRAVQKETQVFGDELQVLSRHVTNAKNASDRVANKFERLSGKLDNVNLLEQHQPKVIEAKQQSLDRIVVAVDSNLSPSASREDRN